MLGLGQLFMDREGILNLYIVSNLALPSGTQDSIHETAERITENIAADIM